MNDNLILVTNDNLEIATVDEKFVIFEPKGEKVYILNEEEKEILSLFDGTADVNSVVEKLRTLYEGENILDDFTEYVNVLREKEILIEKK